MDSLYDELKATGCEIDNHESDLYVPMTPDTTRILKQSGLCYSAFTSQIDGRIWYDVPFAFQPWWDARAKRHGT